MQRQRTSFLLFGLWIGVSVVMIPDAQSAWVSNGEALSPDGSNYKPFIISDGGTGSIVGWYGGSGSDIFARRLLSDGSTAPGWPTTTPLTVCNATGLQEQPVLVSDLAGGALIFWQDARNGSDYDIFAQHINSTGQIFSSSTSNWVSNGIGISTATGSQYLPMAVSDGAGGGIIVWQDGRHGTGNYDIYAQRVDGDGNLLWAPAGIPVCTATDNQINPTIVADGAGGAFIAWQDYRKGSEYDIYVQHLTADGSVFADPHWVTDGLGVCVASKSQFYPVLASDGAGGVFVAWQDFRSNTDNHIFAQHLSGAGVVATGWPVDGSPVCQAQYSQYFPVVAGDGAGGVFVAWQDYRSGTTNHIYAQHLTAGNSSWVADGIPVSTAINGQFSPEIVSDGLGGAFITWYDSRNGATNDIFAHQVNRGGMLNPSWDKDGLAVCLAPNTQQFPVLATSNAGTTVISWQDLRSGGLTTAAIFAQQAASGAVAGVDATQLPAVQLGFARPNPFRGTSEIRLTLTTPTFVRAEILDVTGRRVATLASRSFPAGVHELSWDGSSARGRPAAPGVYLLRVQWPGFEKTQRIVRLR
ncbi:MAG: FlgD immunoglobulin-like domain containing protein [Candidatus Eisenbacteria bacterium]